MSISDEHPSFLYYACFTLYFLIKSHWTKLSQLLLPSRNLEAWETPCREKAVKMVFSSTELNVFQQSTNNKLSGILYFIHILVNCIMVKIQSTIEYHLTQN